MTEMESIIEKAALLHDVGKVCLRAQPPRKITHSEAGVEFLLSYLSDTNILNAVKYHHADALKNFSGEKNDIAYIVYEADNLAAGADRRDNECGESGFDPELAMESVFNVFGTGENRKCRYYLRSLTKESKMSYPQEKRIRAPRSEYESVLRELKNAFSCKSPAKMEVNELLQLMEDTMSFIPSSTAKGQAADISLYDHQKLTAAFAVCMYKYFQYKDITDYKKYCCGSKQKSMREEAIYLLVSGDMSGIQNFIYTIPSKGALKSLRGRSFYLELLLENIADEILSALNISRSCLLYTGGGHFYMLLPNTQTVQQVLQEMSACVNEWFLENFGSRLYLALAWTACAANEFIILDDKNISATGDVFRRVSRKLSQNKLQRYTEDQLKYMFSPEKAKGSRECAVCHTSSPAAELAPYMDDGDEADVLACRHCRNLRKLGQQVLDGDVFAVSADGGANSDAVMMPGWHRSLYIEAMPADRIQTLNCNQFVRMYVKNQLPSGLGRAVRLWAGDYSIRTDSGTVAEFKELASRSGGSKEDTGIQRIAVMRADVDNLGAAFVAGFPAAYGTLTRTAVLSRQLALFFKRYINYLCAGEVNGINETEYQPFRLFLRKKEGPRNVHVVYSGGDDMFIVGAWDDVIELAVDVYRAFRRFANGKLTFSAGIGFFKSGAPISQMARAAGKLEDIAKGNDGKNSVVLFGKSTEYRNDSDELTAVPYHWDEFIDNICGEKLKFLQENFQFGEGNAAGKLAIGKSGLYRIMGLLTEGAQDKSINLARFAYVLSRLKPKEGSKEMTCYEEVRRQFYEWYKQEKERQELLTAVQLVVYSLREKEEMDD